MKKSRAFELILDLIFIVIEILLGFRFVLKILGANNESQIVRWVYEQSKFFLIPFGRIIPEKILKDNYILELTTLLAMFIFAAIYMILVASEKYFLNKKR